MASFDDGRVVLNPYAPPGVNKDAVLKNERARLVMRETGIPDFALTPEQEAQFKGYSDNPRDIRETVLARLYSGDPSAGQPTPEQQAILAKIAPSVDKRFADNGVDFGNPMYARTALGTVAGIARDASAFGERMGLPTGGLRKAFASAAQGFEPTPDPSFAANVVRGGASMAVAPLAFASEAEQGAQTAEKYGATPGEALAVGAGVGLVNGALEMLPLIRAGRRLTGPVADAVKDSVVRKVTEFATRAGTQAAAEGGTEALQQVVQNAVGAAYDPETEAFNEATFDKLTEGAGMGAAVGAVVGGGVGGITPQGALAQAPTEAGVQAGPVTPAPEAMVPVQPEAAAPPVEAVPAQPQPEAPVAAPQAPQAAPESAAQAEVAAPQAAAPEADTGRASVADTPKPGVFYHGSGTQGLTADGLDSSRTKVDNLFGEGVYLTDSRSTAEGYARARGKRTGTPVVYRAELGDVNLLDLDTAGAGEVRGIFTNSASLLDEQFGGGAMDEIARVVQRPGATLQDIYSALSEEISTISQNDQIPDYEMGEFLNETLIDPLRRAGFDGFTHIGGKRTGNAPHKVAIIFDPQDLGNVGRKPTFKAFGEAPPRVTQVAPEAPAAGAPPSEPPAPPPPALVSAPIEAGALVPSGDGGAPTDPLRYPRGEEPLPGRGMPGPPRKPSFRGWATSADSLWSEYQKPLTDYVEKLGTPEAKDVSARLRKAADGARRRVGELDAPVTQFLRKVSGRGSANRKATQALADLTDVTFDADGNRRGATDRYRYHVEHLFPGAIDADLTPAELRIISARRDLTRITGKMTEETRGPNGEVVMIELSDGSTVPFSARENGDRLPRVFAEEGQQVIHQGAGTEAWQRLMEDIAQRNGWTEEVAFKRLSGLTERVREGTNAVEVARVIPKMPSVIFLKPTTAFPQGQRVNIMHTTPFTEAQAMTRRFAQRLAYIEQFGQTLPPRWKVRGEREGVPVGQQIAPDVRTPELLDENGNPVGPPKGAGQSLGEQLRERILTDIPNAKERIDMAMRAANGIPTYDPKRYMPIGSWQHEAYKTAQTAAAVLWQGKLGTAWVGNAVESVGKVPAGAGWGRWSKGVGDVLAASKPGRVVSATLRLASGIDGPTEYKQRLVAAWANPNVIREELIRRASATREMTNWMSNPGDKREYVRRLARETLGMPRTFADEFTETGAGAAGLRMVQDLKEHRATVADGVRIRYLYKFSDAETQALMDGNAPAELYDQVGRKVVQWTQNTTSQPVELSRAGNSRMFNALVKGDHYGQFTIARNIDVANAVRETRARYGTASKEHRAALGIAASMAFGQTLSGASRGLGLALIGGGLAGGIGWLNEAAEDKKAALAEWFSSAIFGPVVESGLLAATEDTEEGGSRLARVLFPVSIYQDVRDALLGKRQYKDMDTGDAIATFLGKNFTASKALKTAAASVGLIKMDQEMRQAKTAFWRYYRKNIADRNVSGGDIDPPAYRVPMRRASEALVNGDTAKAFRYVGEALQLAGGDTKAISASLRGRSFWGKLNDVDEMKARAALPAKYVAKLDAHDYLLDIINQSVTGAKVRDNPANRRFTGR